jgi:hypothetical protein
MRPLRFGLTATIALSLPLGFGCSSKEATAPETIEGKSPADYREQAERGVVEAVPTTPKPATKSGSGSKKP